MHRSNKRHSTAKPIGRDEHPRSSVLSIFGSSHIKLMTLTIFSLLLFLIASTLPAQTPTSQPNSSTHHLKFSVYPIGKANWKEIYYQEKAGNYQTLTFWSYERSPKHEYEGPLPINFYRKFDNPDPKGDPIYKAIASTQLASNSDEHLLFFVATANNDASENESFQIVPLDEGRNSFPLDTVTFVNATGANLEGVFGNKPIFLKTGVSAPYDLKTFYQQETLIGLAVQFEGSLQKVLHSKWSFYPDYREIILLLPPKKADSLRVQAFRITQHKEEITPPPASTAGNS